MDNRINKRIFNELNLTSFRKKCLILSNSIITIYPIIACLYYPSHFQNKMKFWFIYSQSYFRIDKLTITYWKHVLIFLLQQWAFRVFQSRRCAAKSVQQQFAIERGRRGRERRRNRPKRRGFITGVRRNSSTGRLVVGQRHGTEPEPVHQRKHRFHCLKRPDRPTTTSYADHANESLTTISTRWSHLKATTSCQLCNVHEPIFIFIIIIIIIIV